MLEHTQQKAAYFSAENCDLDAFKALLDRKTDPSAVPHASALAHHIPIYDMAALRPALEDPAKRQDLMAEWAQVLMSGAGAIVLKAAYDDTKAIDKATAIYDQIIAAEKAHNGAKEDHFANSGANDRIWNSLQKLCETDAETFLHYFANTAIEAACEAWLGPNYQMTAQVNLVHPGGAAQQAHRDYHLGFQTADMSAHYPAHVHDLSPVLTLQGAIAHCDMPIESGPTKLLPFSQTYRAGYAAWRLDDFRAYFEAHYVQLPLEKGDALFFNPALFHAAGENKTDHIHRMANLLQVSSAFGRAMEMIDRQKMSSLLYPHALKAHNSGVLSLAQIHAAVSACAEGYSFPTNLDRDPPKGGLAPETQKAFFLRAISENMADAAFMEGLQNMADKQKA